MRLFNRSGRCVVFVLQAFKKVPSRNGFLKYSLVASLVEEKRELDVHNLGHLEK